MVAQSGHSHCTMAFQGLGLIRLESVSSGYTTLTVGWGSEAPVSVEWFTIPAGSTAKFVDLSGSALGKTIGPWIFRIFDSKMRWSAPGDG